MLSVAGSGKTSEILDRLSSDRRSLILTYTENNFRNIESRIIQKFGGMPEGIRLFTYFNFLYSFCYRPFLSRSHPANGYFWDLPPHATSRFKLTNLRRFQEVGGRLYHNRLAKLLEVQNIWPLVNARIEKYFDNLFVDEVQDFAGHDFNLLMSVVQSNVEMLFVGDYFQHTFDTSRDGSVNANLHKDLKKYTERLSSSGLEVDSLSLINSYRCSPTVCAFVSKELGIKMESHRADPTEIMVVNDQAKVQELIEKEELVKLFYQKHGQYLCNSRNWGATKGDDQFEDVCVVLNKTTHKRFLAGDLAQLVPSTKNKLYVACTRARGNIFFVPESVLDIP